MPREMGGDGDPCELNRYSAHPAALPTRRVSYLATDPNSLYLANTFFLTTCALLVPDL